MPFVKEYVKRKDATNVILKDKVDIIIGLKGEAKDSSESKSTINLTIEKVNESISKFKENIEMANPRSYGNKLSV
jgi:hypothetical protein